MTRLFPWMTERGKVDDRAKVAPERAQAMMQEASAALERKEIETARTLYSESIAVFHARNMRREEADALHALAKMLVTESDYPAAFDAYTRAIELYRKLNTRGQLAVTLRDAGYASTDRGDFEEAHDLLTESLAVFEATGDKCGAASALEGMGIAANEQKDYDGAKEYFQRSLSLHRQLDLNPESAVSLIYLSIIALTQDELDTAEALYRESIDRFREDNPESSLIPPLLTLGDVAFNTQDGVQIAELLQAALAVFGASRLKRSWDSAMTKLGGVAQRRNVNRSTLEVYRHSFSVDPARDEWGSEAIACLGLGCVAYRQDRPKIGKTLIARSLNLCRLNGDSETVLYVLSYASAYTYRCQHYPDSCQFHVQCADAARNSGDVLQTADAMCYAAFLATWLGEYEDARKYCVEAISVYRKYELGSETARTQSLLGAIFCQRGDTETGAKIHEEAVLCSKRIGDPLGIALALSSMGSSLTRVDAERAQACLDESLSTLESANIGIEPEVLHNIGELDRLEGYHIAGYECFCGSLDMKVEDADRYGCAASLVGCGLIAAASNHFEAAAKLLGAAGSIRKTLNMPLLSPLKEEVDETMALLKEKLGEEDLKRVSEKQVTPGLAAIAAIAHSIEKCIVDPPVAEEIEEEPGDVAETENEAPSSDTSDEDAVAG